ncbi:MAG: hypothetical protein HY906_03095 [Deltaproteobacteria bacterium]|nr:hypothetical protein [Deltaproteobacteria bacterium]
MRLAAPVVVLCLCLGACEPEETEGIADPLAPGAMGLIQPAAGVDVGEFTNLEIRGFPAASDSGDDSLFREIPTAAGIVRSESALVDGADFPLEFTVGADGIGATGLPLFRVVAWLARRPGSTAPAADAPWGTALVALQDCSFACEGTCYCGMAMASADVVLAQWE